MRVYYKDNEVFGLKPIELSKDHQQDALRDIKEFFCAERDEELSDFQAQNIRDFIIDRLGPSIYNQALADALTVMLNNIEDLYGLEKRILPATKKM